MSFHGKRNILWLRAETTEGEARTPLVPKDVSVLRGQGFNLVAERSKQRVFSDRQYKKAGAELVPAGTWPTAPRQALILGLNAIPEALFSLKHRHLFNGRLLHNGRQEAAVVLNRFVSGGGSFWDFQSLQDKSGRSLVTTSYWAGFVGAALAVWAWSEQQLGRTRAAGEGYLPALKPFENREALITLIEKKLNAALKKSKLAPQVLITGGRGLSGTGAKDFLAELGLSSIIWDRSHTLAGGPFPAILRHSILVNCVDVQEPTAPFLHERSLEDATRNLSVITDVSCALGKSTNVIPIYDRQTTFENPVRRIKYESNRPLDLIAIDRLSALLPMESSLDFSMKLVPLLLALTNPKSKIWAEAERTFQAHTAPLRLRKKSARR